MSSLLSPAQALEAVESRLREIGTHTTLVPELEDPIRYFLNLGGKRIRPVLFVLTYQALREGDAARSLNAACAVELFHNFSLLHDDIMDNSALRRGQQTVHVRWDTNRAILAGDAMFALSMEYLVRDFPAQAHALITEYARVSAGVCDGQMEDMTMAGQLSSMDRYIEMIRRKTAMLLGGAMSLAALAAGADASTVKALYDLGETAGIGFQLQDDYLDAFPPDASFGKKVGGDIIEGKMTFLVIRAHELADAATKTELLRLLREESDPAIRVPAVLAIFERLGIRAEAERMIGERFAAARALDAQFAHLPGFAHINASLEALGMRTR
jgi:geranylgeranyl diphosphate synthase type II